MIPQEVYDKACIFSLEEAIESCNRIGWVGGRARAHGLRVAAPAV
jgi:hypothetical protein